MISYEKFYIPDSFNNNKFFGFERDEMIIVASMIFTGMFFSSLTLMAIGVFLSYRYKKFKSSKVNFLSNFNYKKLYDVVNLKYLPRPAIINIYR